ncbi:fungal-specific transcription factor domain-containing protein, partial [Chytridium lagenaria]
HLSKRLKQNSSLPPTPPLFSDTRSNNFFLPTPTFRDSLNPLTSLLDTISISFALEDESVKTKQRCRISGGDVTVPQRVDEGEIWIERMMLEKYFKCHSHFAYEVVHRRTFLETLPLQPAVLRYAMCALGGKLSIPPAPHAVVRSYFEKARALISDCMEDCTLEHVQACFLMAVCGSTLDYIGISFAMLGLAARMAEYMRLYQDPDDDDTLRNTLTWEEKEARRRCFWSIYFCDKMTNDLTLSQSNLFATTASLQPLNLCISAWNRNHAPTIIAVGKRIQMAVGFKPAESFETLEQMRPELIASEAALTNLFDALPPHLRKEPSELFMHEAFSTDETAFARMVARAALEEHMSADPESPAAAITRVGRGDAWDYNYIHALYHALICLTHRPRLLLYAGLYRLPPHNSDEARLLQRTIERSEKSAGFIVTLAERILRAGIAFSQHPAILFNLGGNSTPSWENIFSALSQTSILLGLDDGTYNNNPYAPHVNGVTPPPSIAPCQVYTSHSHPSVQRPKRTKIAEVDSHPFFGFAMMISAMTLADLAALQRRLHPPDSPALSSYLVHCHRAIKLIQRYLKSVTVFWHYTDDYLDGAAELLDSLVGLGRMVVEVEKSMVMGMAMEEGTDMEALEALVGWRWWRGEIGRFWIFEPTPWTVERARCGRFREFICKGWSFEAARRRRAAATGGDVAGEAEFMASLGLNGDGVGEYFSGMTNLDALIREVLK